MKKLLFIFIMSLVSMYSSVSFALVSDISPKSALYQCDGVTTEFAFVFTVQLSTDIAVVLLDSSDTEIELTAGDFTVSLNSNNTGSITTTETYSSAYQLMVRRATPETQDLDLQEGGYFSAEALESALDKNIMITQENREKLSRAALLSSTNLDTISFPNPSANKSLCWDESASALTNCDTSTATSTVFDHIGNYDSLADAVSDIGAAVTTLVIDVETIIADGTTVTIPSTLSLFFINGGSIDGVSGGGTETLNINGPFSAGVFQIFGENLTIGGSPKTEYFFTEWFGAKGDGVTDDFISISNAITTLGNVGGGRLIFMGSVYPTSELITITSNIILDLSLGATIRRDFYTSPGGIGLIGLSSPSSNITILGGTLDGNGVNYNTNAFNILSGVGVTDLTIQGTTFLDVVDFHSIDLANATNCIIENCRFLGFWNKAISSDRSYSESIQLDPNITGGGSDNNDITIKNCTFAENPDRSSPWEAPGVGIGNHAASDGFYSKNIKIIGCKFDSMGFSSIRMINFEDVFVSNCVFDSVKNGIAFILNTSPTIPEGNSRVKIINNIFDGVVSDAFNTETPTLGANVGYHKNIVFSNNTIGTVGDSVVSIDLVSGMIIEGNTVELSGELARIEYCDNIMIEGNRLESTNSASNGILVVEDNQPTLTGLGLTNNIKISDNYFSNCNYRGVHINCAAKNVSIKNNTIVDPDTDGAGRPGIGADSLSSNVSISNNSIIYTGTPTSTYCIVLTGSPTDVYVGNNNSIPILPYQLQANGAIIDIFDVGTPESRISAGIGSVCKRTDGGAGTSFYVKETGTGNTGWVGK